MNIIFFTHPNFLAHQSMPRFAQMLIDGMGERGHTVKTWAPKARAFVLPAPNFAQKWLGYIDQYIIFPIEVKLKLKKEDPKTLFVFTDHALGPWVPLVHHLPHIIHCHDFMAQRSAKNEIKGHNTSFMGKLYQCYIRKGYNKGRNFLSVSKKTKADLHRFLDKEPSFSKVLYNGLNQNFKTGNSTELRHQLSLAFGIDVNKGFILHVGGNQWYKNRIGVLNIYGAWREYNNQHVPLLLIGEEPDTAIRNTYENSRFRNEIYFLTGVSDELLRNAFSAASALLFPSFDEGFGWPIAEAMASGCPVITTGEAPMTEVGGDAAFYIPKLDEYQESNEWAKNAAIVLENLLKLSTLEREKVIAKGIKNTNRFDTSCMLNEIEKHYLQILNREEK